MRLSLCVLHLLTLWFLASLTSNLHVLICVYSYEEVIDKLLAAHEMVEELEPYLLRIRGHLCRAYSEVYKHIIVTWNFSVFHVDVC